MYQALYRKWRPRTFDEVVGQGHITETLKSQIETGRVSHAYLFIGTRGTGKTTCAKLLARAVNCEHPINGNPCNACPSCLGLESGEIMDVVELDAASNNGVDNVRALREEAVFSPVSVKKRVYIIDEAHMLSTPAFNALLKILEEPPEHLIFILATTELHKVPATILSRCQRYSFRRIESGVIAGRLNEVARAENLDLTSSAAALLARLAEGSMRDALSLLDQCSGTARIDENTVLDAMGLMGSYRTVELLDAVAARDTGAALKIFGELWQNGKAADTLLGELSALLRDTLISVVAPGGNLLSGNFDDTTLKHFEQALGQTKLLADLRLIQAALTELRGSQSPKTLAELCLIRLCEPELRADFDAILARVERLEAVITDDCRAGRPRPAGPDPESGHESEPVLISEREPVPVPVPEPAPAPKFELYPEPEPEPEIEAAPIPPSPPDTDFWPAFLAALKGKLKTGVYNLLINPDQTAGELDRDGLKISATGFARRQLSAAETETLLKNTAAELLGRAVTLRFEERSREKAQPSEKLDALSKFGNVKLVD